MLDPKAYALILQFEVGGGAFYYNRFLSRPTVPGVDSGVTIGIGYDLGYVTAPQFTRHWSGFLDGADMARLSRACGLICGQARAALKGLRHICVPWSAAKSVFNRRTLPHFEEITRQTFPGAEKLPPPVYGALVSLVFNRGGSLNGPRRAEMRRIRDHVLSQNIPAIARELRAMKRLWPEKTAPGLIARREAEAQLVQSAANGGNKTS
jgi:hypothetical protein